METTSTFTQVDHNLLSSTKLNFGQKLFISYILGWQNNGKVCFETNKSLANTFGLSIEGIRKLIRGLNTYEFFNSTQSGIKSNKENWSSTHTIKIDEKLLKEFLNDSSTKQESNIQQEISSNFEDNVINDITTQEEKISPKIEDNELDEITFNEPIKPVDMLPYETVEMYNTRKLMTLLKEHNVQYNNRNIEQRNLFKRLLFSSTKEQMKNLPNFA